jgi:hypothetical protein
MAVRAMAFARGIILRHDIRPVAVQRDQGRATAKYCVAHSRYLTSCAAPEVEWKLFPASHTEESNPWQTP